ncbi:MAG: hypothetical protein ACREV0_04095 [Burkholderiales bacterium]
MKLKDMTMLAGLFAGIALFAGCANQPAAKTALGISVRCTLWA